MHVVVLREEYRRLQFARSTESQVRDAGRMFNLNVQMFTDVIS